MNLALWIIAGLLAAVFLLAGTNKLFIPQEKLAKAPGGGWVNDFSPGFIPSPDRHSGHRPFRPRVVQLISVGRRRSWSVVPRHRQWLILCG